MYTSPMSHKYLKPILLLFLKAIVWGLGTFAASFIVNQLSVMRLNLYEQVIVALIAVISASLILYGKMSKKYQYDVLNLKNKLNALSRRMEDKKRDYLLLNGSTKLLTSKEPELILSNSIYEGSQIRVVIESDSMIDGFIHCDSFLVRSIVPSYYSDKYRVEGLLKYQVRGVPKWQWEDVINTSGVWFFVAKLPKSVKQSKVHMEIYQLVPVS